MTEPAPESTFRRRVSLFVAAWLVLGLLGNQGRADSAAYPHVGRVTQTLAELEERMEEAESLQRAAALSQNAYMRTRLKGFVQCSKREALGVAHRSRVYGTTHRNLVQSLRASVERLHHELRSPLVSPLVRGGTLESRMESLKSRLSTQTEQAVVMSTWDRHVLHPRLSACDVSLRAGEGSSELPGRRTVIGLGGGVVCPAGRPADGTPVVLAGEEACLDTTDACGCTPSPVGHGAVLAP